MNIPSKSEVKENPNILFEMKPESPICSKEVEIDIVGKRCVYINNYRVAGGKPYLSENLSQHTLVCTLSEILSAFHETEILEAMKEKKIEKNYFKRYHEQPD